MQKAQEMQVPSLGWEDPLEKEMATHVNILVSRLSWAEQPGGLQSMGSQRVRHERAQIHVCPVLETGEGGAWTLLNCRTVVAWVHFLGGNGVTSYGSLKAR